MIVQATQPWIDGEQYVSDTIATLQLRAARRGTLVRATRSSHPQLLRDPEPAVVDAIEAFLRRLG